MDARPEIDMSRLHDILEADKAYQNDNMPKDPPAKFCCSECRHEYRNDRIAGVVSPSVSMNGKIVSHKTMCAECNLCAYCLSSLT